MIIWYDYTCPLVLYPYIDVPELNEIMVLRKYKVVDRIYDVRRREYPELENPMVILYRVWPFLH